MMREKGRERGGQIHLNLANTQRNWKNYDNDTNSMCSNEAQSKRQITNIEKIFSIEENAASPFTHDAVNAVSEAESELMLIR